MKTDEPKTAEQLLKELDALVTLGVPVPIRVAGLKQLAKMGEIGHRILDKAIRVLKTRDKKKQYWPLMDLLNVERGIAEQCFPDAPSTVPEHMANAPQWLTNSEVITPKNKH